MTRVARRGQAGFSLIELMVAVVITGIVSLSIYALMAQGQGAFRREPSLTERQQNARIAMDLMESDAANAGRGLPLVGQAFTNTLDGQGPLGSGGANSDILEIVLAEPSCPSQRLCTGSDGVSAAGGLNPVGVAGTYVTAEVIGADTCLNPAAGTRPLVLLADALNFSVHTNAAGGASAGGCPAGAPGVNGFLTLGAPIGVGAGWPVGAGPAGSVTMYVGRVVRYQLADSNGDGVLNLERSERGAAGPFQVVARGIDDLQVQYLTSVAGPLPGGWRDTPAAIPACAVSGCAVADFNAIVRNVRITLSARTIDDRVMGPGQNFEFRGQLTTIVTPRAAVAAFELATKTLPGNPIIFN